jgi:hypothetical protein
MVLAVVDRLLALVDFSRLSNVHEWRYVGCNMQIVERTANMCGEGKPLSDLITPRLGFRLNFA